MSTEEKLRELATKVRDHSDTMVTEEAVKTAVVLPFLSALGYDVFDPGEIVPEFTADAVGKKGEKVDYAVVIDGQIRILIECKPITVDLGTKHLSQLFRYFTVTDAKFAVLTNGRTFHFYTDLEEENKLDERPFLVFDLSEINAALLPELRKFAKDGFDVDGVLRSASRLKYTSALKQTIQELMEDPSDEFVKLVASHVYEGRFTSGVREQFTPMVRNAFRELVRETVQNRLSSALATNETEEVSTDSEQEQKDDIENITTDEEKEGFMIVRAIARQNVDPSRVTMRDQKSYCAILVDDNNRKPLVRLWFNRSNKYLGLFDGESEDRVRIETLDDIYGHTERICATAAKYPDN